jgi:hypothetical protein
MDLETFTFSVVAGPGDGIRNGRIYAHGTEESPCIPCSGCLAAEEHCETSNADERDEDVANTTLARAVSDETYCNSHNGRCCVWWNTEQLGLDGSVPCSC